MTIKPDRLALDRATVRRSSVDGYLHVEISPISKANVCPYYGREIPNSEGLGLDADRVYQLLRDPVELAKAANTFNHIPLLNRHVPASADQLPKEYIVGSTGTDSTFAPPYLENSLVIWDASSIAGIETGQQRELSSAYRYVADMTPGVFEGVAYDGRMTNIVGNHVALVEAGRAGSDVLVGDSLPPELFHMKPSKKVAVRAALGAYLRPLLAQDGAIPQMNVITHGNKKIEQIAADAKSVFPKVDEAKLAKLLKLAHDEADMADDEDEDETEEEKDAREKKEAKEKEDKKANDEDKDDEDEKDKEKDKDKKKAEDEEDDEDDKKSKKEKEDDKKANDAAIRRASDSARAGALSEFQAIRQAERDVQPLVGEVVAMDSAESIYRFALDSAGVDNKGVHASALPALVTMAKAQKSHENTRAPHLAADAAAVQGVYDRIKMPVRKVC